MSLIISHGSSHNVSSGGTDNGDIVLSGGKLFVLSAGVADATTVSSGGSLSVSGGGTASGTTLVGGTASVAKLAVEIVSAGGTDLAAVISAGGLQQVFGYRPRSSSCRPPFPPSRFPGRRRRR